jgi:hypothetical protein
MSGGKENPWWARAALAVGLLGGVAGPALAIPVGELVVNGGFELGGAPSVSGWTVGGTANARPVTDGINTAGSNAGFNSFFASPFAVLGDQTGNVAGDPHAGASSITQQVTLPGVVDGVPIETYDLTVSFVSVFEGRDVSSSGDPALRDLFSASFGLTALLSQTSEPLPSCGPTTSECGNSQIQASVSAALLGLSPGTYALTFLLNEADGAVPSFTNTAVGIDNVSLRGTANPSGSQTPVPEPGTLLLAGAGLLAAGATRRVRRPTS